MGVDEGGEGDLVEVDMVEKRVGRERLRMRMRMMGWGREKRKGGRRIVWFRRDDCLLFYS